MNTIKQFLCLSLFLLGGMYQATAQQCPISFTYNVTPSNAVSFQAVPVQGATMNDSYSWIISDPYNQPIGTMSGFYPQFQFPRAGHYMACITYTSASTGCVSSICDSVYVNIPAGNPCLGARAYIYSSLDAMGNPELYASAQGLTPPITYTWSTGATGSQIPATAGMVGTSVCVTATDANCTVTLCDTVQPFPCSQSVQPSHVVHGHVYQFSSNLPWGPYHYTWTYVDASGNVVTFGGSSANPSHVFPALPIAESYIIQVGAWDTLYNCGSLGYDTVYVPPRNGCTDVTLTLDFDGYASETSWYLYNGNNILIDSGGSYNSTQNGTTLAILNCLPDDCYTLIVNDSWGDGMCCAYGHGGYTLTETSSGIILAQGGAFGSQAVHTFCIGSAQPNCLPFQNAQIQVTQGANGSVSFSDPLPGNPAVMHFWQVRDAAGALVATNFSPSWSTSLSNGNYQVSVGLDDSTCQVTLTEPFTIASNPTGQVCNGIVPSMNIYQDPLDPYLIYVVPTLANVPTNYNFQFYWQFDGQSYSGIPAHNFQGYGTFEICYTAEDSLNGCHIIHCDTISIDSLGNLGRSALSKYRAQVLPPVITYLMEVPTVEQAAWEVALFPNPVRETLTLQWTTEAATEATVTILDLTGKPVQQRQLNPQAGQSQWQIPVADLPAGVYFLNLTSEQEQQTLRFIKD